MILITGATGLVGSHLLKELSKTSNQIIACYNNTEPNSELEKLAIWKHVDILDVVALEDAFKNIKQVYHCAAMVSFNPKEKTSLQQFNIIGTANVVNACLDANIEKLVHVSSVAALGRIRNGELISEKMNWSEETSNSEYGKTKYLAELEVWRGIAESLNAVIVNPSIILGAGNWESGSTAIFKKSYEEFPWYTNGASGFVDVNDVAKAMILLMNSAIKNDRFILSGWNCTYQSVFETIALAFNKKVATKKVTPLLANIVWRLEYIKSLFNNKSPLLTKETTNTAQTKVAYDNSKFLKLFPEFNYSDFNLSITRICKELKEKYQVN